MMQRLTRRVLRHKRLVAIGWIAAHARRAWRPPAPPPRRSTSASACRAARAGRPARRSCGLTATAARACRWCRSCSCRQGKTVDLAGRPRSELRQRRAASRDKAVPSSRVAGFGSTGDRAFVSEDGRTAFVYVFPPRSDDPFGGNVDAQRDLRDALRGDDGRRRARCGVTGYDALYDSSGDGRRGPGRPARGGDRRRRRADRARLRVRLGAGARAARHGDLLGPRVVPAALGADRDHRRVADRAVPGRADRPRRVDRLRAADRRPLARGAREGPRERRGGGAPPWAPPAAPWSSRARRSRSACSRWSRCRCPSCAAWATAAC